MSALANHSYVKMNGIGNEIVVVDLRDRPGAVTADDARAVASPQGVHYDQLVVLQPPRFSGTEAFIRIYNNDGSEAGACGNGMRCVARRVFEASGERAATFGVGPTDLVGTDRGCALVGRRGDFRATFRLCFAFTGFFEFFGYLSRDPGRLAGD